MTVVIDVSAAVEILLRRGKRERFEEVYQSAERVIAPDLFVSEIVNVIWKLRRANLLSDEECAQYAEDGIDMVDEFIAAKQLWKSALQSSVRSDHAVYDMLYLVLAEKEKAVLMTNDKSLAALCSVNGVSCLH